MSETETESVIPPAPGEYEPVVLNWLDGGEWPTAFAPAHTMLDLGRQGVLTMQWAAGDVMVQRNRAGRHDFEARIMDLVFHRVGRDREQVGAREVQAWIEEHPEIARSWWEDWEEAATQHALRTLRNAPRGVRLARRKAKRDKDELLERWKAWADELARTGRAVNRHPDELERWARVLVMAAPLGRTVDIAARIEGDLSPSERATLAGTWCPIPTGARLSEALEELLRVLPRFDPPPPPAE